MRPRALLAMCLNSGLLTWLSSADALAAQAGDGPMLPVPIIRLVAAFAICALAAVMVGVALKVWLKHKAGTATFGAFAFSRKSASPLSIIETRQLSPSAQVTRIAYDNLEFLVLVSGQGASILHQKTIPPQDAP